MARPRLNSGPLSVTDSLQVEVRSLAGGGNKGVHMMIPKAIFVGGSQK